MGSGVPPRRKKGVSKDPPTHSNLSPSCDLLKIKKTSCAPVFSGCRSENCSVFRVFFIGLAKIAGQGIYFGSRVWRGGRHNYIRNNPGAKSAKTKRRG